MKTLEPVPPIGIDLREQEVLALQKAVTILELLTEQLAERIEILEAREVLGRLPRMTGEPG
jgi:hypothetical protein